MQFLFVLDSVENPTSANVTLALRLAQALTQAGHSVRLLHLWDGRTPPAALPSCPDTRLAFADERMMNVALENGAKQGSALPLRLVRLLRHPSAVAAAVRQLILHAPRRETDARRAIEQLDAQFHFDVICAVCAPYRSAFALEKAQVGAKKVLWQLDPYASNKSYHAPGGYERELTLLRSMYAAFVTEQAVPDYAPGAPLSGEHDKIHTLHFPALIRPEPIQTETPGEKCCVFCGSLYPGLREPDFALTLFEALAPDCGWTMVMAGGGWEHFPEAARRADALGNRLFRPGPVPTARARALQAGAEVLLSIGNLTDNQLPSKIFEYFAAGKPVLHLSMTESDPALPWMARYPLALVLRPDDSDASKKLALWLESTAGKRLRFEEVAALFPEVCPNAVAQEFLNGLNPPGTENVGESLQGDVE